MYPSFSYGDDETKKREFGESSTSPSCTTVPRGIRRVIQPRRLRRPRMDTCGKNEYALMSRPELIAILKITPAARSVKKPFAASKFVVVLVNAPHCTGRPSLYSRSTMPLSGNL